MILMNMEKIIDTKLAYLKNLQLPARMTDSLLRTMCDYCGIANPAFKDENIYDIHCYKECLVLTAC